MATAITQPDFKHLWDTMKVRDEWKDEVRSMAHLIVKSKDTYEEFVKAFNITMPWPVVGVIHCMESTCNFNRHLHNGDFLTGRTVLEPKGRPLLDPLAGIGKPYTWHESAADALRMKGYDMFQNWSITKILARLEGYNGLGYRQHNINSPYLWSGTNHYYTGKYIKDNVFDMGAKSKQVGAAPLLKHIFDYYNS